MRRGHEVAVFFIKNIEADGEGFFFGLVVVVIGAACGFEAGSEGLSCVQVGRYSRRRPYNAGSIASRLFEGTLRRPSAWYYPNRGEKGSLFGGVDYDGHGGGLVGGLEEVNVFIWGGFSFLLPAQDAVGVFYKLDELGEGDVFPITDSLGEGFVSGLRAFEVGVGISHVLLRSGQSAGRWVHLISWGILLQNRARSEACTALNVGEAARDQ